MKFTQLFKMAIKSLFVNKSKTLFAMFSVILASFSLSFLLTVIDGSDRRLLGGTLIVIGGISIVINMLFSVSSRRREIAIRKIVGAKKSTLLLHFLLEATLISVCGAFVGIGLAQASIFLLYSKLGSFMLIPFRTIAISFGTYVTIGIIFGTLPAIRISNLQPVDTLKNNN